MLTADRQSKTSAWDSMLSREGHGNRHWESADELGYIGGRLDHPATVDVDAAALFREGRGHVGHGAAEVTHCVDKAQYGQR